MKVELILSILSLLTTVAAILFGYYQSIRKLIEQEALNAINKAEELDKMGEEKMTEAVEAVYAILPAVVKPFISKSVLETIIQTVFDKVEEYAQKQVTKS